MGITLTNFDDAGDEIYVNEGEQLLIVCDVGGLI
jgi:hypothetical protein